MKRKNIKLTTCFLLVVYITLIFSQPALADDVISIDSGGLYDDSDVTLDVNEEPGKVEKFLIEFILSIPKSIMNWLSLEDITELVFMHPTAKANEPILFENRLNTIGTYLQLLTATPVGVYNINPTYKLGTVLQANNDNTKVIFGKNSNKITSVLQKNMKKGNIAYTKTKGTFGNFMNMYIDKGFDSSINFPRSKEEILGMKGTIIVFDKEQWFNFENEIYTLRAAYIPAGIGTNLNSSGVVLSTFYGKITSSGGTVTNRGLYQSYLNGLFPKEFHNIIEEIRVILEHLSLYILLALVILYGGVRLLIKSSNTESLTYAKELFKGMFMAALLMKFYYYIFEFLSKGNLIIVDFFYGLMTGNEQKISFLDMLYNPSTNSIAMTLVTLLAVFMTATMNFQYMVRMLSIGVLYAFTPVAAVISIVPERRSAVQTWFNELVGNIFTQSIHAAALCFIIKTINAFATSPTLKSKTFWVAMAGMMSLNGIAMLIRSMMGLEEFKYNSALGFSANMLGLAPLLGLGRMVNRSFGKKKVSDSTSSSPSTSTSYTSNTASPSSAPRVSTQTRFSTANTTTATASPSIKAPYESGVSGVNVSDTNQTTSSADNVKNNSKQGDAEITENGLAYKGQSIFDRAVHAAPEKILKTVGSVGLGLTGGLIMAGAGQNPTGGAMLGATLGGDIGEKMGEGITEKADLYSSIASKSRTENTSLIEAAKNHFGYTDRSQIYNSAYMGSVGRQLGGLPGEILGTSWSFASRNILGGMGGKKANANAYAHDKNIEYMDNLKERIQRNKDAVGVEKIKYDSLNSNLAFLEKKMGNEIYSDEYKDVESLVNNPDTSKRDREINKSILKTMSDNEKYVPEFYEEKKKTLEQELKYSEAQAKYNASVAREMEARNKEKTLQRLHTFKQERLSMLEKKQI